MCQLTSARFACVSATNLVFPLGHFGVGTWGTASEEFMLSGLRSESLLLNTWIANSLQIILSFCYLGLNNICTFLASAEEWNNLAYSRKGLRVSQPVAEQRGTYFLQLGDTAYEH